MTSGKPAPSLGCRSRARAVARLALPLVTPRLGLREFVRADLESLGAVADHWRVREFAPADSRALGAARRTIAGRRRGPRHS